MPLSASFLWRARSLPTGALCPAILHRFCLDAWIWLKDVNNLFLDLTIQQALHDFVLAQGLLPPDILKAAVMQEFVPGQRR
ncbi:MAG: hypothetical protein IH912_11245 [Proteobacteria bacterium]|nr:hypothetical protein [Pseudomonadota bacterium]